MLLGVYTGLHDEIAVQDLGIDNVTAADGLAVGRASGFVGRAMERLLDGFYTLSDQSMYDMLGWLAQEEGIRLEPSALAGMAGPVRVHSMPTSPTWCGRPAAAWCRKTRWRSIWRRPLIVGPVRRSRHRAYRLKIC
jgi:D-serine dehydratase